MTKIPKNVKHFPEVQKEMLCYTKNVQSEENVKSESSGTGNEEKYQLIKIAMVLLNDVFQYMTHPVIKFSP